MDDSHNELTLGFLDFRNIRERNKIYVDKTKLIDKIARQDSPLFFSRPRRFGKTLLLNTLQNLFEQGLKNFRNLDIEKTWQDTTYHVAKIDFSTLSNNKINSFNYTLSKKIIQQLPLKGKELKFSEKDFQYPNLILDEIAQDLPDYSTVLLIDEYDTPLTQNINDKTLLKDLTSSLNNFYSCIKQYTDKFRLIFITGITRISYISIFSAFNNLIDISLDTDLNELLGFTQEDLSIYFDKNIEEAATILNVDKHDLYKIIKKYYDGFQFSLNATCTVYNPWSILSFLKFPKDGLKNYWFKSSGSSSLVMNYIENSKLNFGQLLNNDIYITDDKLSDRYEINSIPTEVLLYQTGYLTLRKKYDKIAQLVFANTEVEDSIFKLYLFSNNLEPEIKFSQEIQNLINYIDQRDVNNIVKLFNNILNDCVSILSNIFDNERSVRDIIYAALPQNINLQKIKERETVQGRSDLELITKKTHLIIEFKRTNKQRKAKSCLKEAISQMQSKRYGLEPFYEHSKFRVAMVISSEEKIIEAEFCQEIK